MTDRIRFLAYDWLTGKFRGEIPFAQFHWTETRIRPGGWDAQIDGSRPEAHQSILDEARTLVYVQHGDRLLFGGPLWKRDAQDGVVRVGGGSFWSYFDHRYITPADWGLGPTLTLTGEQLAFADAILSVVQAQPGGNIRLIVRRHPASSGVVRTRSYADTDDKKVSEALEELAQLDNGFEFTETVEWGVGNPPAPVQYLDLFYPRAGVVLGGSAAPTVWQHGREITVQSAPDDGELMSNHVRAVGKGDGAGKPTATAASPILDYPLLESRLQMHDITDPALLAAAAARELEVTVDPPATIKVKLLDLEHYPLGSWGVGDDVQVSAHQGNALDLEASYRIQSYEATVGPEGQLGVTIDLAEGARNGRPIYGPRRSAQADASDIARRLARLEGR